jgi:FKBP-type peptidyl-prolyl cis-trans isomerase FklB
MRKTALTMILCLGAIAPLLADGTNVFNDDQQRVSYAVGMMLGHVWQQQGVDLQLDVFVRGVKDAQSGGPMLMTPQEMQDTLEQYQKSLAARQQEMREVLAKKNKADGEAFLVANKSKSGVTTLSDGLQYRILTDGNGPIPGVNDTVQVNYRGTLIDGTEFDSTARRGTPAQFQVGQVIPGWREALTRMKAGSVWELFVPSDLAYGPEGHPGIPPNAVLIFNVQLISVGASLPQPAPAVVPASTPLTSDIIKVPSAEDMKKGAKIEIIKPEDISKYQSQSQTN